jgi:DNA-directed RNA polymerase specialized sigma24 family protein
VPTTPAIDQVLQEALRGLDNEDVRIFYDYFDELKRHARRYLGRKVRTNPGESAVVQSALLSLFCDLSVQDIPLSDVDEHGYPMLWPLLLRYLERHCDKWNKYWQARKRRGVEVPRRAGDLDPPDPGTPDAEESHVIRRCQELYARLTDEEREVFDLWLDGRTLDETAAILQGRGRCCGTSKVSYVRKRIRQKLDAL